MLTSADFIRAAVAEDPIGARDEAAIDEMGKAFTGLLKTIDELVTKLGGSLAARVVLTQASREAMSSVGRERYGYGYGSHDPLHALGEQVTLCDTFVLDANGYAAVSQRLRDIFRLRNETPADFCARFFGANIVIRGERMYYETAQASVMIGHCYQQDLGGRRADGDERWSTAITSEAEKILSVFDLKKPSVGLTHCKSRAAAIKGLLRIANECFKVEMKPLAETANAAF